MTGTIQWDDSVQVRIEEFDAAHKHLIDMANDLIRAAERGQACNLMGGVLEGLIEYADSHFAREEELMSETDYPELDEHRRQHKRLLNDVRLFKSQYIAGAVAVDAMVEFLTDWILTHIHEHDRHYGPHLRAHGIH